MASARIQAHTHTHAECEITYRIFQNYYANTSNVFEPKHSVPAVPLKSRHTTRLHGFPALHSLLHTLANWGIRRIRCGSVGGGGTPTKLCGALQTRTGEKTEDDWLLRYPADVKLM